MNQTKKNLKKIQNKKDLKVIKTNKKHNKAIDLLVEITHALLLIENN